MADSNQPAMIAPRLFLRQCRASLFRSKVADSSGAELTGGKLLTGTLIIKQLLEKHALSQDEKHVGLFLPPSVGGALANAAVSMMGKVAVNLNYTLSEDVVDYCIKSSDIKHVVSSRKFLEKRPFKMDAELVYLEDLKEKVTGWMKISNLLKTFLLPSFLHERMLGLTNISLDDLMTIVFTSGSTGEPKGVMLSHGNVVANTHAVNQLFHLTKDDVMLGVLPFFHSFGYTATLWLPLTVNPKAVYHFNPLDAKMVGKLAEKHAMTILLATPTFLRTYLKRCTQEQFNKLNLLVVGAEKMPLDLFEAFKEKFNVEATEGYGTTELSPVAAFNIPANRSQNPSVPGTKVGSVGRVIPGSECKVVDPDTREDLGVGTAGLLLIKGPSVMQGYLNQPEKTADVLQDGWYNTGDIAVIDEEGFISITGRQSRFSKIGGEMVPHIRVEDHLRQIVEDPDDDEPALTIAVTSVPDEKKGERLIVLHTKLEKTVDDILKELGECDMPNLWMPGRDAFIEVEEIPVLGTGKLDLKGLQLTALEKCGLSPVDS